MKWIVAALLIPALAYAAGLRIDFKILSDKIQHKTDPNAEALLKMGIDPGQIEFRSKPWWTFKPEDSLFRNFKKWDPIKKMSDESWEASQVMKQKLGPSIQEQAMAAQAQAMAAQTQARLAQQRMVQEMQGEDPR